MRKIFMAGAAAVSMAVVPAIAFSQAGVPGSTNSVDDKRGDMSAEQQATYNAWPAERRVEFDRLPAEHRVYYWTLDPIYHSGFWALTPEQRAEIYAMEPDQQTRAWDSVRAQVSDLSQPQRSVASSGTTTRYVSNETVQGNRSPMAQQPADYPVCKSDRDDSCINPWAAGKRGPGVNRPLDYWPGKPASEIGG